MLAPCVRPALKNCVKSAIASVGSSEAGATLQSATIAADGLTLTLSFDVAVKIGSGGSGGVIVRAEAPTNAAVSATYSSGSGTTSLEFALDSEFYKTENVFLYYTQPGDGIENNATGEDITSITAFSITNNSNVGDGILEDQNGDPIRDQNNRAIRIDN